MPVAVPVLGLILYGEEQDHDYEEEVEDVDGQEGEPEEDQKDNCEARAQP